MTRSCFFGLLFLLFTMRFIFHQNFGEYVLLFPNIKQANLLSTCFGPPLPSHRCWSFWRKCLIIRSASVFFPVCWRIIKIWSQFPYCQDDTWPFFLVGGWIISIKASWLLIPIVFSRTSLRKKWVSPSLPCLRHFMISWIWWLRLCQFLIVGFLLREVWIPGVFCEDGKVCPSLGVDLAVLLVMNAYCK